MDKIRKGLIPARPGADLSYISPDLRHLAVLIKPLKLDPRNPRRGDVDTVAKSLKEYGLQKPITVYKYPNQDGFTVITGNHTTKAAIKNGWKYIAAVVFTGTPEKAQTWAMMDNRSSDLATYDDSILTGLLKEAQKAGELENTGYSNDDLEYMSTVLRQEKAESEKGGFDVIAAQSITDDYDPLTASSETREMDIKDALKDKKTQYFPSGNKWGLPDYLPDMFAEPPNEQMYTWPGDDMLAGSKLENHNGFWFLVWGHSSKNCNHKKAILSFYVPDNKLENLWRAPARFTRNIAASGIYACLTPDFSMWENSPFAERLWNQYRERWFGRLFQESGIKIVPNLSPGTVKIHETLLFTGLPKKIPLVSMNFQTGLKRDKQSERFCRVSINTLLKHVSPDAIIVYGGRVGQELTLNMFPNSIHVIRVATISISRDMYRLENPNYKPDPLIGDAKKGAVKHLRRNL